jgi:hypothetical protein
MSEPSFITREELEDRVRQEEQIMTGDDRAWWYEHRVDPFHVTFGDHTYYAVAVSISGALVFFDDEDEFGSAILRTGTELADIGLYGDLVDAVRGLRDRIRTGKPEVR